MGFFTKLFGSSKKAEEEARRKAAEEEEMLKDVIDFIRINAEGEDGDAEYQLRYGTMFVTGEAPGNQPFPKDIQQGIYWLSKAADQGNLDALTLLGQVYMDIDPAIACRYYRKAAEKDHVTACENLGMAYAMGTGLRENKVEAHKWFLKAANLGSAFAQYIVGFNYFNGVGTITDADKAFQFYFKAAEQGQPNAQFEIGKLYEYGGNDLKTARSWYAKAAAQGHEEAQLKLKTLK